jgi:hypothetical protein
MNTNRNKQIKQKLNRQRFKDNMVHRSRRKGALIAVGAALIVLFISMLAAAGTFSYLTYSEPDTIKAIL